MHCFFLVRDGEGTALGQDFCFLPDAKYDIHAVPQCHSVLEPVHETVLSGFMWSLLARVCVEYSTIRYEHAGRQRKENK